MTQWDGCQGSVYNEAGKSDLKKKRFWKKVIVFIYLIFQRQYESHIKKTFNSSEDAKTTVTKFGLP